MTRSGKNLQRVSGQETKTRKKKPIKYVLTLQTYIEAITIGVHCAIGKWTALLLNSVSVEPIIKILLHI